MSEIGAFGDAHPAGTLMWIGDRQSAEFQEPFAYCELRVAQLALRRDQSDAIGRRATAVRCVLISCGNRQSVDTPSTAELSRHYPNAAVTYLLGTLCEGERSGQVVRSSWPTHYWHQWNQFLPQWIQPCTHGVVTPNAAATSGSVRSVAIVASTASIADPLMELATSAGAAVAWCRRPDLFRARNFDAIWWDDSVAKPATAGQWSERLQKAGSRHVDAGPGVVPRQQHAWIVQTPRIEHYRQARRGGIDIVLSKPGQMDLLSEMLATRKLIPFEAPSSRVQAA